MLKTHLVPNDCTGPVYSLAGRRVRGIQCSALITSVAAGASTRLELPPRNIQASCHVSLEVRSVASH